jgi:hypothetical protein
MCIVYAKLLVQGMPNYLLRNIKPLLYCALYPQFLQVQGMPIILLLTRVSMFRRNYRFVEM